MLDAVKRYLRITWDDEDVHLTDMIDRSKAYLNELAGAELDYDSDGLARSLLLDRVRYVYNNATEYFEENFHRELLRLQLSTGVALMDREDGEDVPDEG